MQMSHHAQSGCTAYSSIQKFYQSCSLLLCLHLLYLESLLIVVADELKLAMVDRSQIACPINVGCTFVLFAIRLLASCCAITAMPSQIRVPS